MALRDYIAPRESAFTLFSLYEYVNVFRRLRMQFRMGEQTSRTNADKMRNILEYCSRELNREIAIRELRGAVAANDYLGYLGQVSALRHEEGILDAISELDSLMRGRHIGYIRGSAQCVSGGMAGRRRTLALGENRESAVGLKWTKSKML